MEERPAINESMQGSDSIEQAAPQTKLEDFVLSDEPLPEYIRNQISAELENLQNSKIQSGKSKVELMLFRFANELAKKAGIKAPINVMIETKSEIFRTTAYANPAKMQIAIGDIFIKHFLLYPRPEDRTKMLKSFKWGIAHEIGHLSDPIVKLYQRIEPWIMRYIPLPLCLGYLAKDFSMLKPFKALGVYYLYAEILTFLVRKPLLIRSEYKADEIGAKIIHNFTIEDAKTCLEVCTTDESLKMKWLMMMHPHPSNEKRIARLQKIYDKIHAPQTRPKQSKLAKFWQTITGCCKRKHAK